MKGEVIILEQGVGIFQGELRVKSDEKLRLFRAKAVLEETEKKELKFEARLYKSGILSILVRPDKQTLITFDFSKITLDGKYKDTQGKVAVSGEPAPHWECSFKMKKA